VYTSTAAPTTRPVTQYVASFVSEDVARKKLPGAGDVQYVCAVLGLRQWRERFTQTHDALGCIVQNGISAGLNDVDALNAAVPPHCDRHDQLPVQIAASRLIRIVEIADALDSGDPSPHVARVFELLRAGGDELALRALRVRRPTWRSISAASLAISRLCSISSRLLGSGLDSAGTCSLFAALVPLSACVVTSAVRCDGCGRGEPGAMGTGAIPGSGLGTSERCGSAGRSGVGLSPPPCWECWARKSAFSGAFVLRVWVKMTSSVWRRSAGRSTLNPTPSATTTCPTMDRVSVAPSRSPVVTLGDAGGCDRLTRRFARSGRKDCQQYSS